MARTKILLESGTNELELLLFEVGGQRFGMNVLKVQSIQQLAEATVTQIPATPGLMRGMMLYREQAVPLLSLSAALDLPSTASHAASSHAESPRLVVLTEFNGVITGFLVDHVERICRLSWRDFVPLARQLECAGQCITGSLSFEGAEVLVVDLEYILSTLSPSLALGGRAPPPAQREHERERVRIYFVDDSRTIRRGVVRLLAQAGYVEVTVFEDGLKALDALLQAAGTAGTVLPDIMVSDIEMPRLDGLTLCRKIKHDPRLAHLPVVMFSSLINDQMAARCEAVQAQGCIAKPDINQLITRLDALCLDSA